VGALRDWAIDEAAAKAMLDRLVTDARSQAAGDAEFWSGRDLDGARDWQRRNHPSAAWVQLCRGGSEEAAQADFQRVASFLDQSTDAQHRSRRRARLLVWGVRGLAVGVTLASLATVVVGWHLQQKALARDWAGQAILQVVQDPARSARLALEALKKDPTHDRAEFALRRAMAALEVARTAQTLVFPAPIQMARYSLDDRLLAVASGNQVWLLDEQTLLGSAVQGDGRVRRVEELKSVPAPLAAHAEVDQVYPLADGRVVVHTVLGEAAVLDRAAKEPEILGCGEAHWITGLDVFDGTVMGREPAVAIGCSDGAVRVWNLPPGGAQPVWASQAEDGVLSSKPAFAPDGNRLAIGDSKGNVRILALPEKQVQDLARLVPKMTELDNADRFAIEALAFNKNRPGQLLVSDGAGNTGMWTLSPVAGNGRSKPLEDLRLRHDHPVSAASFPPPGAAEPGLLLSIAKRTVSLWAPPYTAPRREFPHDGPVLHASLSADGEMAVSTGSDGLVRVWSTPSSVPVAVLRGHTDKVTSALWHPAPRAEGGVRRLITASQDHTLRIWHIQQPDLLAAGGKALTGMALSAPGQGDAARVWLCGDFDFEQGGACAASPLKGPWWHDAPASALAKKAEPTSLPLQVSPSRVSLSRDGQLGLFAIDFEGASGGRGMFLVETEGAVRGGPWTDLASPLLTDVYQAVFASAADVVGVLGDMDDAVKLWRVQDLRDAADRAAEPAEPLAVVPSTGQRIRTEVALSPDGRWIATVEGASVKLWRRTDQPLQRADGHALAGFKGGVTAMAFTAPTAAAGLKFVVASSDRTARVWTLDPTGKAPPTGPVLLEGGHSATLTSASFSPDGHWVVTSGMEGSIRIWDAATGAEKAAVMNRHRGKINQALFDPSGERIVSVGDDGRALVSNCRSCVMKLDELRLHAVREVGLNGDDLKWLHRTMKPN
jgi:WD40 repeat protein